MIDVDIEQRLGAFDLAVKFAADAPIVGLFGRSGAGKTSVVNAIAGIAKPDRGTIRVAVFQTGGILAQFGPPLDILAAPASEFVARFVGQDRGLKRLSLLRGRYVDLGAAAARPRRGTPLPRRARRPKPTRCATSSCSTPPTDRLGWISQHDLPQEGHAPGSDGQPGLTELNKRTTLKDALSMMLDADVQTGIVVDRNGAVQGLYQPSIDGPQDARGRTRPAVPADYFVDEAPGPNSDEPAVAEGQAAEAAATMPNFMVSPPRCGSSRSPGWRAPCRRPRRRALRRARSVVASSSSKYLPCRTSATFG